MKAAIRLAVVATVVAAFLGLAPRHTPGAEAAGGSLYAVSITGFCGRVLGSAESASIKVKITLKNTGENAMTGYVFAEKSGHNNSQPIGYQMLRTNLKTVLDPGESVTYVAFGTGVNLAGTFRIRAGIAPTPTSAAFTYRYTEPYASPESIPAC